jgi:hypothetical protein
MKPRDKFMDAWLEMINIRLVGGFEAYMLTMMFKSLEGSAASVDRQMNSAAEIVYSRILTRLVKHPRSTPIIQMPFWLSCPDWPVQKIDGMPVEHALPNDGRHLHAIVLVPPNARTGERLSDVINRSPRSFLVGRQLTVLHAQPIEKTVAKAAMYVLKSVARGRASAADILVLPKSHSEESRALSRRTATITA